MLDGWLCKPKTQYGEFQIKWLDIIRCIAESNAAQDGTFPLSVIVWTDIYNDVQNILGDIEAFATSDKPKSATTQFQNWSLSNMFLVLIHD